VRNPLPTPDELRGVAFGNDVFVAVGTAGTILTSTDSATWHPQGSTRYSLSAVAFGNGLFVAVGSDAAGSILVTSTNGVHWTEHSPGTDNSFSKVIFDDDSFWVVSDLGTILTSRDGLQWTTASFADMDLVIDIARGGGRCVVLEYPNRVGVSIDGVNWTNIWLDVQGPFSGIAFGNGKFVVAGGDTGIGAAYGVIFVSTNGITWQWAHDLAEGLTCVAFHDGRFISTAYDGSVWTSEDGTSWTQRYSEPGKRRTYLAVGRGNGRFVAVGDKSLITSADAIEWTRQSSDLIDELSSVAYGNGRFVALAARSTSMFVISTNGVSWRTQPGTNGVSLHGIEFIDDTFYAVGETWADGNGILWKSLDGESWTPVFETEYRLHRVVEANGLRFVLSEQRLFVSTNGLDWALRNLPGLFEPRGMVYGNGCYALVDRHTRAIFTSRDALTWSNTWTGPVMFKDLAFGLGRFVAVGYHAEHSRPAVLISEDGMTWALENAPALADSDFYDIHYANGAFVVLDDGSFHADGAFRRGVWSSTNPGEWNLRTTLRRNAVSSLAFGKGSFVAVGLGGTILQSGSFAAAKLEIGVAPQGAIAVELSGEIGREYLLQASTGISGAWTNVLRINLGHPKTNFVLHPAIASRAAFFRAVSPESSQ